MKPLRHVLVCTNERASGSDMPSCGRNAGGRVLERFLESRAARGLFRVLFITETRCLGICPAAGATVVVYPEAVWYVGVVPDDVAEIFDRHLLGGTPVARLVDPRFA